jgi:hypothetical protein
MLGSGFSPSEQTIGVGGLPGIDQEAGTRPRFCCKPPRFTQYRYNAYIVNWAPTGSGGDTPDEAKDKLRESFESVNSRCLLEGKPLVSNTEVIDLNLTLSNLLLRLLTQTKRTTSFSEAYPVSASFIQARRSRQGDAND